MSPRERFGWSRPRKNPTQESVWISCPESPPALFYPPPPWEWLSDYIPCAMNYFSSAVFSVESFCINNQRRTRKGFEFFCSSWPNFPHRRSRDWRRRRQSSRSQHMHARRFLFIYLLACCDWIFQLAGDPDRVFFAAASASILGRRNRKLAAAAIMKTDNSSLISLPFLFHWVFIFMQDAAKTFQSVKASWNFLLPSFKLHGRGRQTNI